MQREDCVLVSLMIVDRQGAKTLVGGFTPSHATVTLPAELGDRAVIDCSDNRARPHWTTAATVNPVWTTWADVPIPRPEGR